VRIDPCVRCPIRNSRNNDVPLAIAEVN
jgi:hypothetical protein